jgi:ribosome-binding protein aMBF1 (putative translation factor)
VRADRLSEVIMNDHLRQVRAARALLNWEQEMLAEKALVALTALKRLESERRLPVHESTRDQVRRALESAGVLFVESSRGRGVMLLNEPHNHGTPRASRKRSEPGL